MTVTLDLQIASEAEEPPSPALFQAWVNAALSARQPDAELTVRVVDEPEMHSLNLRYRNRDSTTNVLSFPADLPPELGLPLLGDLVICAPVVDHEASVQHKPRLHHWAHMTIHGCLHLAGYDHIEEQDAEVMETLETEILQSLGIPDPYTEVLNLAVLASGGKHPKL